MYNCLPKHVQHEVYVDRCVYKFQNLGPTRIVLPTFYGSTNKLEINDLLIFNKKKVYLLINDGFNCRAWPSVTFFMSKMATIPYTEMVSSKCNSKSSTCSDAQLIGM